MADLLETILSLFLIFMFVAGAISIVVVIFIQSILYIQDEDDK